MTTTSRMVGLRLPPDEIERLKTKWGEESDTGLLRIALEHTCKPTGFWRAYWEKRSKEKDVKKLETECKIMLSRANAGLQELMACKRLLSCDNSRQTNVITVITELLAEVKRLRNDNIRQTNVITVMTELLSDVNTGLTETVGDAGLWSENRERWMKFHAELQAKGDRLERGE